MIRRSVTAGLLAAIVVGVVVLATGASGESSGGKTYKLQFDNAFGLSEGGDFRVGGVRAGSTTKFELQRVGDRTLALVTAKITEPGFADFRTDASCEIRPQSVIGEYFVDCQPGKASKKFAGGATLKVSNTASTIPADLVNNVLRRPYRERLRLIIAELGTGLAGRPQDLAKALRRAHPGLRETSKVLRILGNQTTTIQNFITDTDTVVAQLEARKEDVSRWVSETARTASITATRRTQLAASFKRFPRFLDEFRPTLVALGNLSDEQVPALRDLRATAPRLTTFLEELGPFSSAAKPSITSLGKTSVIGRKALRDSRDEIKTLLAASKDTPGFAKPLRQFLQTLDDRKRAIETDPRAKQTAPPAPDKTAADTGKGFTGFEDLLNYAYWQTLTINSFDEFSHVLRTGIFVDSTCGGYSQDPSPEDQERCGSYTGPHQPGLLKEGGGRQFDPTDTGNYQSAAKRDRAVTKLDKPTPVKSPDEQRGAGAPEAAPTPGKPDPSKPDVKLTPDLQGLVNDLGKNLPKLDLQDPLKGLAPDLQKQLQQGLQGLQGQGGNKQSQGQLLDFLLAR